jgi:hypothetical protein
MASEFGRWQDLKPGEQIWVTSSRFDGMEPAEKALLVKVIGNEVRAKPGFIFDYDPVTSEFVIQNGP